MGSASRSLPSGFPNLRVSRSRTGLDRDAIIAAGRSLPVDSEGEEHTLAPTSHLASDIVALAVTSSVSG